MGEQKRVMYRGLRAIDVAMMAAGTMAGPMAVDKTVTAAKEDHSAARTEDGPRTESTASLAAWARRASRRAPRCGRARRAAPSAVAPCALAPRSAVPRAREVHFHQGDLVKDRSVTPAVSEQSRGEGNSIN